MSQTKGKRAREPSTDPQVNEALHCIICIDVVVDARQSSCCGALLCGKCAAAPSVQECCPHCRHEQPAFYKDPFRERQAAAVVVTCKSCDFSGKRDDFNAHVALGHESPEDKAQRLEEKVEALEAELKRKDKQVAELKEAAKAQEVEVNAQISLRKKITDNCDSILRAAFKHRIADRAFVARHTFSGQEGFITQAWSRDDQHAKVDIKWLHYNVSVFFTITEGPMQAVEMQLLHPEAASKDKKVTVTPEKPQEQWGHRNWIAVDLMEKFCHGDDQSIIFALRFTD